jgi:hypothetical protein
MCSFFAATMRNYFDKTQSFDAYSTTSVYYKDPNIARTVAACIFEYAIIQWFVADKMEIIKGALKDMDEHQQQMLVDITEGRLTREGKAFIVEDVADLFRSKAISEAECSLFTEAFGFKIGEVSDVTRMLYSLLSDKAKIDLSMKVDNSAEMAAIIMRGTKKQKRMVARPILSFFLTAQYVLAKLMVLASEIAPVITIEGVEQKSKEYAISRETTIEVTLRKMHDDTTTQMLKANNMIYKMGIDARIMLNDGDLTTIESIQHDYMVNSSRDLSEKRMWGPDYSILSDNGMNVNPMLISDHEMLVSTSFPTINLQSILKPPEYTANDETESFRAQSSDDFVPTTPSAPPSSENEHDSNGILGDQDIIDTLADVNLEQESDVYELWQMD